MLNPSKSFSSPKPSDAIDYIINHPNYSEYLEYLKHWKEEFDENSDHRAENISYMFGLAYVGYGDRRVCLYYEDFIIKLPLESCNCESNEKEYELFNLLKSRGSNLFDYLCPILDYRKDIIVTPHCSEFDFYDEDDFFIKSEQIVSEFKNEGVLMPDLDAPHQFGDYQGFIKILDYEDYELINKEL